MSLCDGAEVPKENTGETIGEKCILLAAGDPRILETPVPWRNLQRQQQSWNKDGLSLPDKLCILWQALWRNPENCESQKFDIQIYTVGHLFCFVQIIIVPWFFLLGLIKYLLLLLQKATIESLGTVKKVLEI